MANALAFTFPNPTDDLPSYVAAVHRFPFLQEDEERELAINFRERDDLDAAWRLVTSHLRFVVSLARRYRGYGLAEEDLIQEGNVGLMKAVRRFDPNVGVRLSVYAAHWIKAEIQEFVLRNWRIVKVATTKAQRKLFFNLRGAKKALTQLTPDEAKVLAEDLNVDVNDVVEMEKRLSRADIPFDKPQTEDWAPGDWLSDNSLSPEELIEQEEHFDLTIGRLREAMETLDERSQTIIQRRWVQEPKATLRELAEEYGISNERVRQIEAKALRALRENVASLG